jgi:hypothetical protein
MRADIIAFAKAVPSGKLFIFALQMSIKHLALLKGISARNGFKAALLVAAIRYGKGY